MKFCITAIPNFLKHIWRDVDGGAAVELAFIIPVIATLAVGGFDFGRALMQSSKMESAARAGAQYALYEHDYDEQDTAAIAALKTAIETQARTDFGDNSLAVTTTLYCHCPGTGAAQQPCQANCGGGGGPVPSDRFVIVETDWTYSFTFDYPGLPGSLDLTGEIEMRIQ